MKNINLLDRTPKVNEEKKREDSIRVSYRYLKKVIIFICFIFIFV